MIQLTRLDQSRVLVNPDVIKYIEQMPDTIVQFLNGDSMIVTESVEEIVAKFLNLKKLIHKPILERSDD